MLSLGLGRQTLNQESGQLAVAPAEESRVFQPRSWLAGSQNLSGPRGVHYE